MTTRYQPYYGHPVPVPDVYKPFRAANSEVLKAAVGTAYYENVDIVAEASVLIALPGALDLYLFPSDAQLSQYAVTAMCDKSVTYEDTVSNIICAFGFNAEQGPTLKLLVPKHYGDLDVTNADVYRMDGYKNKAISLYTVVEKLTPEGVSITLGNRTISYNVYEYKLVPFKLPAGISLHQDNERLPETNKRLPTFASTLFRPYIDKTFKADVVEYSVLWSVELRTNELQICCDGSKGIINGSKIDTLKIPTNAAYPAIAFSEDNLPVISLMTEKGSYIYRAYKKGRTIKWESTFFDESFDDFAVYNDDKTKQLRIVTYERATGTLTDWLLLGTDIEDTQARSLVPKGLRFNTFNDARLDLMPTYFIEYFKRDIVDGNFNKLAEFANDVIVHSRNPFSIMDQVVAAALTEVINHEEGLLDTADPLKANVQRAIDTQLGEAE